MGSVAGSPRKGFVGIKRYEMIVDRGLGTMKLCSQSHRVPGRERRMRHALRPSPARGRAIATKEAAMGERIDKLCDDLKDRLNGIDQRLTQMKDKLDASRKEDEAAFRANIEEARRGLEGQRKEHEDARSRFKARVEAKQAEVKSKIDEWKKGRETKKLVDRADAAEQYACAAVDVAQSWVREAEVAILEAVDARMDAEDALAASKQAA
jgi:hypothetical protein